VTFKEKLLRGDFLVTGEIAPHKGVDPERILKTLGYLKGVVDAVNVTDNQRSCVRASALAVSKIILDAGVEPVYQLTCRDRNRIGLQSDLLGAHMLGIRTILALTGDHPLGGDHPDAKPVWDLDSTQLIAVAQEMNEGKDMRGNQLDKKTDFLIGAALDTNCEDMEVEALRVRRKLDAGARFFQSQVVYEVDRFRKLAKMLPKDAVVLAGIIPLKSKKMAEFMNAKIPNAKVPEDYIRELEQSKNQVETGVNQAAKIIREIRPHCRGVHVMALGSEEHVKTLLQEAGIQ